MEMLNLFNDLLQGKPEKRSQEPIRKSADVNECLECDVDDEELLLLMVDYLRKYH